MWASKNGEITKVKAKKPSGNANRRRMTTVRRVRLHGNRAAQTKRQRLRLKIRNVIGDKNANVDHLITQEGKLKLVIRLRRKTKARSLFNTARQPVVHKKTLSSFEQLFWNHCCVRCLNKAAEFGF